MRVGLGFDVHAFDAARPLVLGGVPIEGAPGLVGWSDADVVSHAIADAMLGAAGLGDLGSHFPKESVAEGVSSQELLARVVRLVAGVVLAALYAARGFAVAAWTHALYDVFLLLAGLTIFPRLG